MVLVHLIRVERDPGIVVIDHARHDAVRHHRDVVGAVAAVERHRPEHRRVRNLLLAGAQRGLGGLECRGQIAEVARHLFLHRRVAHARGAEYGQHQQQHQRDDQHYTALPRLMEMAESVECSHHSRIPLRTEISAENSCRTRRSPASGVIGVFCTGNQV